MDVPTPAPLPYFRLATELPGPLPTSAEIQHASKPGLSPRRSIWEGGAGVFLIRGIYIIKCGPNITETQGNALLSVERNLDISTPRLYAMYRDPQSGFLHLVMEYVPDIDLESLWSDLRVKQSHSSLSSYGLSSYPRVNGPFKAAEEVGSGLAIASRINGE
ncbi:hypothetical protein NW759_014985 [Fusarium solani]|nr:hypothetical protein NW759_014985 [Fusarium solani]